MRLLVDECLPRKIKSLFVEGGHVCTTVTEAGFSGKKNGELLTLAEGQFDLLVTVDKNIRYQQNIARRKIAVLIIRARSNSLEDVRPYIPQALELLKTLKPGEVVEVGVP